MHLSAEQLMAYARDGYPFLSALFSPAKRASPRFLCSDDFTPLVATA
jgi:hypothetical protein